MIQCPKIKSEPGLHVRTCNNNKGLLRGRRNRFCWAPTTGHFKNFSTVNASILSEWNFSQWQSKNNVYLPAQGTHSHTFPALTHSFCNLERKISRISVETAREGPKTGLRLSWQDITNNLHSSRLNSDVFKLKTYAIADSVEFKGTSTSLLAVHQSGEATFVQTNTSSSSSTRIDKLLAILDVPRHPSQASR